MIPVVQGPAGWRHSSSQILLSCDCGFSIQSPKAAWKWALVILNHSREGWVSSLCENPAVRARTQSSPGSSAPQVCVGLGNIYSFCTVAQLQVAPCLQDRGRTAFLADSLRLTCCLNKLACSVPPTQNPLADGCPKWPSVLARIESTFS